MFDHNDLIIAASFVGAAALAAINTFALFRDGGARGIRPYSNMYFFFHNTILCYTFARTGLPLAAAATVLHMIINTTNVIMIVRYQGLILFKKAP